LGTKIYAQKNTWTAESGFIKYLYKNGLYEDLNLLLKQFEDSDWTPAQKDSVNHWKGLLFDKLKMPDSSIYYLKRIDPNAPLYKKDIFLKAYNFSLLGKANKGIDLLSKAKKMEGFDQPLLNYELSGFKLLTGNLEAFDTLRKNTLQSETLPDMNNMYEHYSTLKNYKSKSTLQAGLLEVIPGLGKMCKGNIKQGLLVFLPITLLGIMSFEGYHKKGFESPHLYIFGSLFTLFYIGNIWGSTLAVKINNIEKKQEINSQILLDLRIPVDKLFRSF
jgi:hypothetical protein